jgi:pimeloyl-ACP methyl ester carboxylesterase
MPQHRHVRLNAIDVHIAEQGEGPLVLLLHGFPETWFSWRHQIEPIAAAGYHVVVPDQRGYGTTDRPDGVDQYSIFHLVGDVVSLIRELGQDRAVVVGHDWGSMIAWNTALLRPGVVRGVIGVSIAPQPRGTLPPTTETRQRFGEDFYQNYFQKPGIADASLGEDPAATLRLCFSGIRNPNPAGGFLGLFVEPEALPQWLTDEDLATFAEQFAHSGFTGGLNYYRNLDRNWEQTAAWQDAPIHPPSLLIRGEDDSMRIVYPMDEAARAVVPNLRGVVDIPECGHWTQQERPEAVTAALLQFLGAL